MSVTLGAAKARSSHMSRRTPLGKKDSCCCLLLLFIYEGPRNEKTETGLPCQGRSAGNLAFLGASNERFHQHDDVCVCVYHLQNGVRSSAEALWGVGPSWEHVVRWQRRSQELSATGLDCWHHRHTSTRNDIIARPSHRNRGDTFASGLFYTGAFKDLWMLLITLVVYFIIFII